MFVRNYRYELRFAATKNEPNTFYGYLIEQIRSNKSGVSIGYKILEEDTSDERYFR